MQHIAAIGFDLFDTLVTVKHLGLHEALGRLMQSLQTSGFALDEERFVPVYRAASRRFVEAAHKDGRETHNRFWITAALYELGQHVRPDDPRIAAAVEAYFSAFVDYATPLPDTLTMLAMLHERYRLGLLSNLTHAPAALQILHKLGMAQFFDAIMVSGDLGYRKPHPRVFQELVGQLGIAKEQTAFVGDNFEADVQGAQQAGLHPIWMTHMQTQTTAPTTPVSPLSPPVATIRGWHDLYALLHLPV